MREFSVTTPVTLTLLLTALVSCLSGTLPLALPDLSPSPSSTAVQGSTPASPSLSTGRESLDLPTYNGHHVFLPPSCAHNRNRTTTHPHQFTVVALSKGRHNWRPSRASQNENLIGHIPTADQLHLREPTPYVIPFCAHAHHLVKVTSTDQDLVVRYDLKPIIICSNLGVYPPATT